MKAHHTKAFGLVVAGFLTVAASSRASYNSEAEARCLMESYLRYLLVEQIGTQGRGLAENASDEVQAEVNKAVGGWCGKQQAAIRGNLQGHFGPEARPRFEAFISEFAVAESSGDEAFLGELADAVNWDPPGERTYPAFRMAGVETWLGKEVESGAGLLGEIQTWVGYKQGGQQVPPLQLWLTRDEKGIPGVGRTTTKPKPKPSNSLRDAEAVSEETDLYDVETASPLDSFSSMRDERRQRVLEESQAGMQQVAQERDAWEQEYANEKLAAAQEEAEAMKRQAEKLAATDAEALEQRKNSWGAKCKQILAGTISATVGGFTGAVGSRAADEAVNAIFNDD